MGLRDRLVELVSALEAGNDVGAGLAKMIKTRKFLSTLLLNCDVYEQLDHLCKLLQYDCPDLSALRERVQVRRRPSLAHGRLCYVAQMMVQQFSAWKEEWQPYWRRPGDAGARTLEELLTGAWAALGIAGAQSEKEAQETASVRRHYMQSELDRRVRPALSARSGRCSGALWHRLRAAQCKEARRCRFSRRATSC